VTARFFLAGILALAGPASAQSSHELSSFIGVSAGSSQLIGKSEQVRLVTAGVRYARTLSRRSRLEIRHTVEGIPYVRLNHRSVEGERETAWGWGIAPVGFEFAFRPAARVEPVLMLSGGFLRFDENIPDTGRRFNFFGEAGAGLRFSVFRSTRAHVSYRYHHLSNAYRAEINPGFDSHLFSVGLGWKF
jgi:hypothetical protein